MAFQALIVSVVRGRNVLLVVGALGLCGCAVVGPRSITAGRGVYAEVINRTEDEQILNVVVRQRYNETFGMISVSSVTASLRFRAQAGTNIGIGDSDDYAGNLVPLSAGIAYEENPTISYVPLSGEDFTRRMLSPVSTKEWVLIASNAKHPGRILDLAARNVNGLRNPILGDAPPSPEFGRFIELYERLLRTGVLDVVRTAETEDKGEHFWDIHDYEHAHGDSVREFLDLLGIDVKPDGSPILLPVRPGVRRSRSAIHVETRSPWEVLRVFGAGVEIPSTHLEAGIVEPVEWAVPGAERFMTIRSSEKRPKDATVRIRFRDRWFYIDATDSESKRAFVFLRTFIGIRLAEAGAIQRAPVITIPAN